MSSHADASLGTGEPPSPSALKPIKVYPVREENGEILVGGLEG
ncbi:hypothetical protein [Streptomyces malaysiensis]|uniref:Uncharacterized protein n=1 Tax=Streptomyces malaysiensis subsp. samsunensis TaxID=459658 RepID=A0A9X2RZK3_STRMQ|nr:hypothetical protein [Streptomyces samsunensis]MCQ8836293.1 hypothetical protein [Streptomyces samsunensis]